MSDGHLIKSAQSGAVTGFRHPILIMSSDYTPPHIKVTKVLGLVRGNAIRSRHIGRDIMASFRNIVGGEIRSYTKLLAESREQALDRMVAQAIDMGANAVIGTRFTTTIMANAAELLAYGTAVILEES